MGFNASHMRAKPPFAQSQCLSRLLKKAPGQGTGPTKRAEFTANPVGRVPSRGIVRVFQQPVREGRRQWSHRRQWEEPIAVSKQIPIHDEGGQHYVVPVQIIIEACPGPHGVTVKATE
jgi:hypothetical protein